MEDNKDYNNNNNNNNSRKRARDDSEVNSPESKLIRVDSYNSGFDSPEPKLYRVDSENSVVNSPEAKRIQDDLLNILDDSDTVNDPDPAIQGLDSVIKSFEEEILFPQPPAALTSDSGESQLELGYLLEASDDELGLPPSFSSGDEQKISAVDLTANGSGAVGFGEMLGFEDEIPGYGSFGFGIGGDSDNNNDDDNNNNNSSDFVTLGDGFGLFDYSEESCEPADISEFSWRPESLSAL